MKAVVFDMDGVLVDSEPLWHEAEQDVFGRYGVALSVADCQQTTGVRIDNVVRHWREKFPDNFKDVDDKDVVSAVVAEVVARVKQRGTPMRGAFEAIEDVARRGWQVGLASSSPLSIIDAVLARLQVRSRFAAVVSAEHMPSGKPDPMVYLEACRALGVAAEDAVAIEDSNSGIKAGLAAGMVTIAVPDTAAAAPEALKDAHVVLGSLLELPPILDGLARGLRPRRATHADAPALSALISSSVDALQTEFLDEKQRLSSRAIMSLDTQLIDDGTYFVVEIVESAGHGARHIAGCGGWSRRNTLYGGDGASGRDLSLLDVTTDRARVRAMYTHPRFVRRGVASLILKLCESAARREGFARAQLASTLAGEALYRRDGWVEVERFVDDRGGAPVPLITMTKAL